MNFSDGEKAEAQQKIDGFAAKLHQRGDQARARKRELDPDGRMTQCDWWAVALLPKPLLSLYASVVRARNRKKTP